MSTGPIEFSPSEVRAYYKGVPGLKLQAGKLRGPCPIHGGKGPNFAVELETGRWFCHSTCGKGGDILGFEQELHNVDYVTAKKRVFEIVGRPNGNGNSNSYHANSIGTGKRDTGQVRYSAQSNRDSKAREGWRVVAEFCYGDNLRKVRLEHATRIDGKKGKPEKAFVWEHLDEGLWYAGKGGLKEPLYVNKAFLERGKDSIVLGVEGEGKAEAADALGLPAFSFREICEASAAAVRGLEIVLWPDRDEEGAKYAEKAISHLRANYCKMRIMDPPADLPESGDIVDAIALGYDRDRIAGLMDAAKPLNDPARQPIRSISDIKWISHYCNEKIVWACDGIVAERGVTVLTSDSGVGKTMLALDLAWKIFNGQPFAGRATTKRPVLILDRENPPFVIQERCELMGITEAPGFIIFGGWVGEEAHNVDSLLVIDWIKENPNPLIILDSLIAFSSASENDATETRGYFSLVRHLADLGAALFVLHHCGKGETSKNYRGSSDIKGSVDLGFLMENVGADPSKLEKVSLTAWKTRTQIDTHISLKFEDGHFISGGKSTTELLIELLMNNPRITKKEFEATAQTVNLGRNRARTFLDAGVQERTIDLETGKHNAGFYTWMGQPVK